MKVQKQYDGTCYIGIVGNEIEECLCRDSVQALYTRAGDGSPTFVRATKGYEARQSHIDKFLNSNHSFIFLVDQDNRLPPDALERLRSHRLPYVSGLYMRRQLTPMAPIWFLPWSGKWPYEPWLEVPERGKLHLIGASGWGCILIHREVVLAVRAQLKGEWEVLEDDMDIMPYDLKTITDALAGLRALVNEKPSQRILLPALQHHLEILENEIQPLRIDKSIVGSDIRFPYFALKAGYQLYGDPDVRCGHHLNYHLTPDDYNQMPQEALQNLMAMNHANVMGERRAIKKLKDGLKAENR